MSASRGILAGRAFVQFNADKSPFLKALRSMEGSLKDFGGKLMSIGARMATVGAIAAAGFASAATAFASAGSEIQKQAKQLGLTTDQFQLLQFAAQQTGKDIGDLAKQFADGSLDLEAYRKRAEELGVVMSGEDVNAASRLSQVFGELTGAVSALWQKVGAALAPTLTDLGSRLATIIGAVVKWVDENRPLVATIAAVAAGVAAAGAGLVAVGGVLAGVGVAFGAVSTIIAGIGAVLGAVLSPVGLLVAGVTAVGVAFFTMTDAGKQATSTILQAFQDLVDRVKEAWGGISDALAAGDLALAGRIAFQALNIEWMKATQSFREVWQTATGWIYDSWDTTTARLASLVNDFTAGVQSVWINTVDILFDAWDGAFLMMAQVASGMISGVTSQLAKLAGVLAEVTGIDIRQALNDIGKAGRDYADRIAAASADSINTRGQARNERLAKIEADRKAAEELLFQDLQERILRRQLANEGKNDKAAKDLREAMTDYAKALKEAADKKQGVVDAANPDAPLTSPGTGSGTTPEIDAVRAALAQQQDIRKLTLDISSRAKAATTGTFSAAAASRLTSTGDPNTSILRDINRGIRQLVDKKATLS